MNINNIIETLQNISLKYPGKIAIKDKDEKIGYSSLYEKSEILAAHFKETSKSQNERVCILLENSINYVISIISSIKAGIIFVPVSYDALSENIEKILHQSKAKILITTSEKRMEMSKILIDSNLTTVILVDKNENKIIPNNGINMFYMDDLFQIKLKPIISFPNIKNSIYICYKPEVFSTVSHKEILGSVIRHESVINYLNTAINDYEIDQNAKIICLSGFYYDCSIGMILYTLCSGGELLINDNNNILPRFIIKNIINNKISHLDCSNDFFEMFVDYIIRKKIELINLKKITISGVNYPLEHINTFKHNYPSISIFNKYGPSETTMTVSHYKITSLEKENTGIPIGKPFSNVDFIARNSCNQLIKENEIGELLIGGIQVMDSYWNNLSESQSVLLIDESNGQKYFQTGSYVTKDIDGNYQYIGNKEQVVIRDNKYIVLLEIEDKIKLISYIENAFCISVTDNFNGNKIILFVKLHINKNMTELELDISNSLFNDIAPDVVEIVDNIPILPNGQINKSILKHNFLNSKKMKIDPRTPVEEIVAGMWSNLLNIKKLCVYDNFFDLGGHSLLATQLISRINNTFQMEFPLRNIFISPTVAELSVEIEEIILTELEMEE